MADPLDVNNILELLPTLLPRSTSSPLPHTTDALAALVHTIHTALAFRLIRPATADITETAVQEQQDFDDGASETTTAVDQEEAEGDVEGRLWTGWNHRAEDSYSFEYRHEQSSMTFRLRVGRMGGRVQIDAMAEVRFLLVRELINRMVHLILFLSLYAIYWNPDRFLYLALLLLRDRPTRATQLNHLDSLLRIGKLNSYS